MISLNGVIREGMSTLLIYSGVAYRRVAWSITGDGTLEPLSNVTDHNGKAAALFTPDTAGDIVIIGVDAGA